MSSLLRRLTPRAWRQRVHRAIRDLIRWAKAPRMIWGFEDPSGIWRGKTRMSDTLHLAHPERVSVGDNVFIGHWCVLDGTGGLEIGEGCQLAGWNGVYTHSSHVAIRLYGAQYTEVLEQDRQGYKIAPVSIGAYVFLGAGAKVFPGVTIGAGALVAANSVVTRDVAPFQMVQGNPAVPIGDTRRMDARYLADPQLQQWYEAWQPALAPDWRKSA